MILNKKQLYTITIVLAFCSIAYELIFTKIFSLVIGSQVKQYNSIISIFTFTLGLGSLAYLQLKKKFIKKNILLSIEIALFSLGALSPIIIIYLSSLNISHIAFKLMVYSICGAIGFLSGIELPLMIDLSRESDLTLSADYFGMVMATLLIPIFFIPYIGLASSSLLIALINIFILFYIKFHHDRKALASISLLFILFAYVVIYGHTFFNQLLRLNYLPGNLI